jgi:hypothetical protein
MATPGEERGAGRLTDGRDMTYRRNRPMTTTRSRIRLAAMVVVPALLATACWKPSVDPIYSVTVISDVVHGQSEVDGLRSPRWTTQ